MKYDPKLLKENHLYRYFTNEIYNIDNKLRENSRELERLVLKQKELKAGKHELVQLRREIIEKVKRT